MCTEIILLKYIGSGSLLLQMYEGPNYFIDIYQLCKSFIANV
jgi:hypothetical protein